ncbi:unnamed protein product [Adineta steineri]|uniref:3-phytase n=1 Tax=Adineta steineri TaxID=433720 RepID=A0A813YJK2_9BILA|nr:unnamed protein product [Adineta steineri]CAF3899847.1 unnamed protein product [Adineta steineri]
MDLLSHMIRFTIIFSFTLLYLTDQHLARSHRIISKPQIIELRLSPNSNLLVGSVLDASNRLIVQNQMKAALIFRDKTITSPAIHVLKAIGTISEREKQQHNNFIATRLSIIYKLMFNRFCNKKCQIRTFISIHVKFLSLIISLDNMSNIGDDEVTDNIKDISQYWGYIRPYVANELTDFGVINKGLPRGCHIEQAHVLQRHGSRYPEDSEYDGLNSIRFAAKIKEIVAINDLKYTGPLSFLNTWSLRFGLKSLMPSGITMAYQSGVDFWNKYGRVLYNASPSQPYYSETERRKLLFRTSENDRDYESTIAWAKGFFGPYNTTDRYSILSISQEHGSNNTLFGRSVCRNERIPNFFYSNSTETSDFYSATLSSAAARLSVYASSNTNLTHLDALAMQSLCVYEYIALGSSHFCSLFTLNEWRNFELASSIELYKIASFGWFAGRARGIGYVEELIARLTNRFITTSHSSVNSTLDSSSETFPLHQPFYMDMSHGNHILSVLTALSIDYFHEKPSQIFPPLINQRFRSSLMSPFGGQLITEKISCMSSTPLETNSIHTKSSSSQNSYSTKYKFVRMKLNNAILPLDTIRNGFCSVGRRDGLCPMNNFLASQVESIKMANLEFVCFGNYTLGPNPVITDGTVLP